ncbi:MAG: hypothetical protein ACI4UO_00620, partial [Paludibacteraceae bacterium]
MKTSWQNKIGRVVRMWLAGMAMAMPLSAQAETVNELLNAMNGDTITLACSNNTTTYYLMAAESSNSIVADTSVNKTMRALWNVQVDGTGFRLQNVAQAAAKNDSWLRINKGTYQLESTANSSTMFYIGTVDNTKSTYTTKGRGLAGVYYIGKGNKNQYVYYDANPRSPKWSNNGKESTMRIEQWCKKDSVWLEIAPNHGTIDLPFVRAGWCSQTDESAKEQAFELIYTTLKYDKSDLYNVPETKDGNYASNILLSVSHDTLAHVAPEIKWVSSNGTTSTLPATLIDNAGTDFTETPSRPMFTITTPSAAVNSDEKQWRITVTPEGDSPINLKRDGEYVDYVDNLVATITAEGITGTHSQQVLRCAGHYQPIDTISARVTPANYLFDNDTKTVSFNTRLDFVKGGMWLNVKGGLLKNKTCTFIDTTYQTLNTANLSVAFTYYNEDNTLADWLSASSTGNAGDFSVTVTQNSNKEARRGAVVATYTYTTMDATYKTSVSATIAQLGTEAGDYVAFHHSTGTGNTALDEQGYQPVHTVEKTIYYAPGADVQLQLNERNFIGYYRWYDYETGKDPKFNTDGTPVEGFWITEPKTGGGTLFKSLNTN